jgi:thioredoxin reductase (NADPH)
MTDVHELLIIGGGPSAYTAALYAARGDLEPFVIEGYARGGQLMITSDVDNYPGFRDGILGPALMEEMRAQAERFGTVYETADVTRVEFSRDPLAEPHVVEVGDERHLAHAVIVATGATARQLGVPGEQFLQGRGVSYCAVCDGAFFRDRRVVIVGGGDSAMEEATFLAKFASEVIVVHRRAELRASKIMQDRARANPKIRWVLNAVVEEVLGEEHGKVVGVRVRDVDSGETQELETDGVFVAIGHDPTTGLFEGILDMDDAGYLITHDGTATNVPGVFAAGDVVDHVYRQAITAAGMGCMAALDAERWLTSSRHAAKATAT